MEINELKKGDVISFKYKNWKGETSIRNVIFKGLSYGNNKYHIDDQFLMNGFDLEKLADRTYAVKDISEFNYLNTNINDNKFI